MRRSTRSRPQSVWRFLAVVFATALLVAAERGHHDTVSDDSWAAMEYSKIRWMYDQLDIGDRTEIEFHNGGHTMQKRGTFEFLHKHLNWPTPK